MDYALRAKHRSCHPKLRSLSLAGIVSSTSTTAHGINILHKLDEGAS
jgi:hypothetical protein